MPETEPTKPKRTTKKKAQPISDELNLTELVSELRGELTSLRSDVSELKSQIQTGAETEVEVALEPEEEEGLSEAEFGALLEATSSLGQSAEPELAEEEPIVPVLTPQQSVALTDEEIAALFANQDGQPQSLDQSQEADTLIVPAEEIMAMLGLADPASETTPEATTLTPSEEVVAVTKPEVPTVLAEEVQETAPAEDLTPTTNLDEIDPSAVARVPGHLAAAALALPLCVVEDELHCRCVEPFDDEALKAISDTTGLKVVPHRGDAADVLQELRRRFGNTDEACVAGTAHSPAPKRLRLAKLLRREG